MSPHRTSLTPLLFEHICPFWFGYGPSLGFVVVNSYSGGERFDSPSLCNFEDAHDDRGSGVHTVAPVDVGS
jgi:hypothetical protein